MDEAARIRREAEEYADAARRRADAFAEARIRRIRELSDRLIATAETLDRRFGEALSVKEALDELILALGEAARRVAEEAPADPAEDARPPGPRITPRVRVQDVREQPSQPPLS